MNRTILSAAFSLLAAAGSAQAQCSAQFSFNNFEQHATLTTVGSAGYAVNDEGHRVLRLTQNVSGQAGAAWYTASKAHLGGSFSTVFTFQTGPNSGDAADGFAFVIQNQSATAIGAGGSGMGYAQNGDPGITSSLAIEFDTFGFSNEFPVDHVSLQSNGLGQNQFDDSFSIAHAVLPFDINDAQVHTAQIVYDGSILRVYVDNLATPVLTTPINFTSVHGGNIIGASGCTWVGFTGGTGLATANQDILTWQFSDTQTCIGMGVSDFHLETNPAAGSHVEEGVVVTGTGPKTFQWFRNTVPLQDGTRIHGSHTERLIIDPITPADSGQYDFHAENPCSGLGTGWYVAVCGSSDFNGDGDIGTDSDIEAFFACLAGSCCPTCGTADFNGDGDIGTDADIEAFFRVLAGGSC